MNLYELPLVPSEPEPIPPQLCNPTNEQRRNLLKYALKQTGRIEDYPNIVNLLSPPPDITTHCSPGRYKGIRVAVIGAGLAGLSASFELRKLGFDITIFDALTERIGGRVYTYYFDKERNLYGELGPMRIPVGHETTWHYINLFGLDTRPFIQTNENGLIYVRNTRVRNDMEGKNVMRKIYPKFPLTPWEKRTPWTKLIEFGLGSPLFSLSPEIRKEILEIKPRYHPQFQYWNSLSIRQVLELMGLSKGAIDLIGSLSPFIQSFFYNSYSEFMEDEYAMEFSFLYEIIGGMTRLPVSFYESLNAVSPKEYLHIPKDALGSVHWKRGHWVKGIQYAEHQSRVALLFSDGDGSRTFCELFDYVLCTVPFSCLRNIDIYPAFSNLKMEAVREVNYTSAQKTLLLCKERFWEQGRIAHRIIGGGSFTDMPITSIYYPSDHGKCIEARGIRRYMHESFFDRYDLHGGCSPYIPGVLLASYNLNLDAVRLGNQKSSIRYQQIKEQIRKVHGLTKNYLDEMVEDHITVHWNTEPWFKGAFAYYMPRQKELFSYAMITPEYNNRVFFAGEHTSATHSWMQGALHSGMTAANMLARQAGMDMRVR
ncbi:MAG: flavin monoamine oxidase family protein [Bacillota bacterium]